MTCGPGGADVEIKWKGASAPAGDRTRDVRDARDAADHWARPLLCLDLARVEEEVNAERFLNLKQKFRLSELTTGNGGVAVRFHAPATRWRGGEGQKGEAHRGEVERRRPARGRHGDDGVTTTETPGSSGGRRRPSEACAASGAPPVSIPSAKMTTDLRGTRSGRRTGSRTFTGSTATT